MRATTAASAAGRFFNVGYADGADHRDWIARCAAALGWRGEVTEAPAPADSPIAALDLRYPLWTDSWAFRDACGWREPTSLDAALAETIADERRRG